jgi:hypothetical protein
VDRTEVVCESFIFHAQINTRICEWNHKTKGFRTSAATTWSVLEQRIPCHLQQFLTCHDVSVRYDLKFDSASCSIKIMTTSNKWHIWK